MKFPEMPEMPDFPKIEAETKKQRLERIATAIYPYLNKFYDDPDGIALDTVRHAKALIAEIDKEQP